MNLNSKRNKIQETLLLINICKKANKPHNRDELISNVKCTVNPKKLKVKSFFCCKKKEKKTNYDWTIK